MKTLPVKSAKEAAREGFEPSVEDPKSSALPLGHRAKTESTVARGPRIDLAIAVTSNPGAAFGLGDEVPAPGRRPAGRRGVRRLPVSRPGPFAHSRGRHSGWPRHRASLRPHRTGGRDLRRPVSAQPGDRL